MRESCREAARGNRRSAPVTSRFAREEYLQKRSTDPGRLRTLSDSWGAGMLRKDIFSRLTLVAGFLTPSERVLRPYATRAKAGHERSCCQRPARYFLDIHDLLRRRYD